MTAIVAANRGEVECDWAEPHVVGEPLTASISEAAALIEREQPVILDVREPAEYASGHLPRAVSLPQADLATCLHELAAEQTYLIVCARGVRSLRAANYLSWLGFERAISMDGGTNGWRAAGLPIEATAPPPAPLITEPDHYFHGT
jgi:rhodanese-related sulfurtransferase